jgi:prophage regulatory protein
MKKHPATDSAPSPLPATLPKLLTLRQLRSDLTLSRTTVWRGVKAGTFPKPIQLTPTRIAWKATSILEWLAAREANGTTAVRDADGR